MNLERAEAEKIFWAREREPKSYGWFLPGQACEHFLGRFPREADAAEALARLKRAGRLPRQAVLAAISAP